MKTVVIYESMYGNTHLVADTVATVAGEHGEALLVPVSGATPEVIDGADLVIVGGPTHAHGLSRPTTRAGAVSDAAKHDDMHLDPDAEGPGLRTWFQQLGEVDHILAAAFDTRFSGPATLTGQASKGIGRRLRHHGFSEATEPESFLVDRENHLVEGEVERARTWTNDLFRRIKAPRSGPA